MNSIVAKIEGEVEEINIQAAISDVFSNLQTHLNAVQCSLVSLIGSMEKEGSDYKEAVKLVDEIEEGTDSIHELFKELKSITTQISKPETADERAYLKQHKADKKAKKAADKLAEKEKVSA